MSKPAFVYVTYIASTPEKVFKALTDSDATAQYWFGNAVTSDWKVGSPVTFQREGKLIVSGKVLEHTRRGGSPTPFTLCTSRTMALKRLRAW